MGTTWFACPYRFEFMVRQASGFATAMLAIMAERPRAANSSTWYGDESPSQASVPEAPLEAAPRPPSGVGGDGGTGVGGVCAPPN